MGNSYNEGNLTYMRKLADAQGISVAELTKRRRLDEEFGSPMIANVDSFEPILGSKPGMKGVSHQDTSHIGAEERATGKAVGSTAGSVAGAILGPMVGIPPQIGSAIGGAAGGAIGGGSPLKEGAIATGAGAGDAYTKELTKEGGGKPKFDFAKVKGIFQPGDT
jgi:hypothetical protein